MVTDKEERKRIAKQAIAEMKMNKSNSSYSVDLFAKMATTTEQSMPPESSTDYIRVKFGNTIDQICLLDSGCDLTVILRV